jgi:uncharacterized protein (DUF849 family)
VPLWERDAWLYIYDERPARCKTHRPPGGPISFLQAALNGGRARSDHAAVPITPAELASAARDAAAAGADAIHFHVRAADGTESLAPSDVERAITQVRAIGVPFGISTGAWIVPDPAERLALIRQWRILPDFVSINFDEAGAAELASGLLERNVGIEAGIAGLKGAEHLVRSGLADHCLRILLEPADQGTAAALGTVVEAEAVLDAVLAQAPRLLHGVDATAWTLLDEAGARGYGARIGFEDTLTMPDGSPAPDNAELVRAARERLALAGKRVSRA